MNDRERQVFEDWWAGYNAHNTETNDTREAADLAFQAALRIAAERRAKLIACLKVTSIRLESVGLSTHEIDLLLSREEQA